MSTFYDEQTWISTRKEASQLATLDDELRKQILPEKQQFAGRDEALNKTIPFYLKYRNIVKKLTDCHDQIIPHQKREIVKELLDYAIARMLEYKREIVEYTCSDYLWPDNFMVELKLTPDDIALTTPAYYTTDRKALLEQREKCIEDLIANANKFDQSDEDQEGEENDESEPQPKPEPQRKVSLQTEMYLKSLMEKKAAEEAAAQRKQITRQAIILIQCFEKTRQARCIRIQKKIDRDAKDLAQADPDREEKAAIIMQKIWRGFRTRKLIKRQFNRTEEAFMTTLGPPSHEILEKDVANLERKREIQTRVAERYDQIKNEERAELLKKHGLRIMQDLTDEIRNWYLNWYNELGFFDNLPSSETGGSVLIANGQTLTPEEYLEGHKIDKDKEKETKKGKSKKEAKKKSFGDSEALDGLLSTDNNYRVNWQIHENEKGDHRLDLIREDICYELGIEIRKAVDDLMRLELRRLNDALKKDAKLSKEKIKLPKQKKPKKHKKKRGSRATLTDHEVEDLFGRLVLANVIKTYPKTRLRNWIGDLSYQNFEAERDSRDHHPSFTEIAQLVMEYCILPLGSKRAHQLAPLVRSINISGLPDYGKKFLVHAVCTETGATLFDLTPEVLTGEFESKKEVKMLTEMVAKLSKLLAPSVIFVDGGHKPWLKKVPPELRYVRPKRFAQMITKLVKGIKPGDQVLFLSTSSEPHKAANGFVKVHDKFIVIPLTDYNTLYMYYKQLLSQYSSVDSSFDVSCLARMSVGYPIKRVRQSVEEHMNLERRMTLKFKPLQQTEIFEELLNFDNKFVKEFEHIRKFEKKTPLAKKKAKMIANLLNKTEDKDKKKKNKK